MIWNIIGRPSSVDWASMTHPKFYPCTAWGRSADYWYLSGVMYSLQPDPSWRHAGRPSWRHAGRTWDVPMARLTRPLPGCSRPQANPISRSRDTIFPGEIKRSRQKWSSFLARTNDFAISCDAPCLAPGL